MKKLILISSIALFIACNSSSNKSEGASDTASKQGNAADESVPPGLTRAEYDKAQQLIATSDCLTCHQVDKKSTGPAYKDVSLKYESNEANITMLAGKIIKGGSGNWGTVPMTPHDSISVDDAKTMVKYILSLKNAK